MSQPEKPNQPHRPYPRVIAYPAKPRRHRPVNPHAEANALAMQHQDIAEKVARNLSRRTGHPVEDLRQIAMMGIIQASRRYDKCRGNFRSFARKYANGEVFHFLRNKGFLIKVPPSWREIYSKGEKMLQMGVTHEELPSLLGISDERWSLVRQSCTLRIVTMNESFEIQDQSAT